MRGPNLTITGSTHYNGPPDLLTVTNTCVTETDYASPLLPNVDGVQTIQTIRLSPCESRAWVTNLVGTD